MNKEEIIKMLQDRLIELHKIYNNSNLSMSGASSISDMFIHNASLYCDGLYKNREVRNAKLNEIKRQLEERSLVL